MSRPLGYKRRAPGSAHEAIARGFAEAGGVEAVAAILPSRSPKRLYEVMNPDCVDGDVRPLSYHEARALTLAAGAHAFAEDLAIAAGGLFVPLPAEDDTPIAVTAARLGVTSGKTLADLFTDLQGGALTPAQARELVGDVRDTARAVALLYAELIRVAGPPGA